MKSNSEREFIARTEGPPDRTYAKLLQCKSIRPQGYFLTGDNLVGCYTHWIEGRAVPHVGDKCAYCEFGSQLRWKGYISAFDVTQGINGLLFVTEYAAGQLLKLREKGESLRGLAITLARAEKKENSRIIVKRFDAQFPGALPAGFDPRPILIKLWRINTHFNTYFPGGKFDPAEDFWKEHQSKTRKPRRKGGK